MTDKNTVKEIIENGATVSFKDLQRLANFQRIKSCHDKLYKLGLVRTDKAHKLLHDAITFIEHGSTFNLENIKEILDVEK